MRTIDITQRYLPATETRDGVTTPSGPVDVVAMAQIRRCCPGCHIEQDRIERRVRVECDGGWWGTKVTDVDSGDEVPETYSVLIELPPDAPARAIVLAHSLVETTADASSRRAYEVVLCDACIGRPA